MVKRSICFATGSVLVVIGLLGFLLPFFPGFVPFIIGLVFLSRSSSFIRRKMSRLKTMFPKQYAKFNEIKGRFYDKDIDE
ncbi:MAG: hypothetical protein IT392_12025 [Nitrospirae bacterium]|nr:hypothetical protein [Nitrospirota bacterium]